MVQICAIFGIQLLYLIYVCRGALKYDMFNSKEVKWFTIFWEAQICFIFLCVLGLKIPKSNPGHGDQIHTQILEGIIIVSLLGSFLVSDSVLLSFYAQRWLWKSIWVCGRARNTLKVQPIVNEISQGTPAKNVTEIETPIVIPHVPVLQTQRSRNVRPNTPVSTRHSQLRSFSTIGDPKNIMLKSVTSSRLEKKTKMPQQGTKSIENSPNNNTGGVMSNLTSMATFKLEPFPRLKSDSRIDIDKEATKEEFIRPITPVFTPPGQGKRSPKASESFISSPFLKVNRNAKDPTNKEVFPTTLTSMTKLEGQEENPPMTGLTKSKDSHMGKESL